MINVTLRRGSEMQQVRFGDDTSLESVLEEFHVDHTTNRVTADDEVVGDEVSLGSSVAEASDDGDTLELIVSPKSGKGGC
jgi:hypothetical protein